MHELLFYEAAPSWRIRPWTTVVGDAATTPVRSVTAGAPGGPS